MFWLGVFIATCFGYELPNVMVVIAALQSAFLYAFISIEEAKK
jgi:hypothetical protein